MLTENADEPFNLLADWKKNTWHRVASEGEDIGIITAEEIEVLKGSKLYHLPQRKAWQSPPENALSVAYSLDLLPRIVCEDSQFLVEVTEPVVFQHSEPEYKRWVPSRHGE